METNDGSPDNRTHSQPSASLRRRDVHDHGDDLAGVAAAALGGSLAEHGVLGKPSFVEEKLRLAEEGYDTYRQALAVAEERRHYDLARELRCGLAKFAELRRELERVLEARQ